jgi:hypothetical protein
VWLASVLAEPSPAPTYVPANAGAATNAALIAAAIKVFFICFS